VAVVRIPVGTIDARSIVQNTAGKRCRQHRRTLFYLEAESAEHEGQAQTAQKSSDAQEYRAHGDGESHDEDVKVHEEFFEGNIEINDQNTETWDENEDGGKGCADVGDDVGNDGGDGGVRLALLKKGASPRLSIGRLDGRDDLGDERLSEDRVSRAGRGDALELRREPGNFCLEAGDESERVRSTFLSDWVGERDETKGQDGEHRGDAGEQHC